MHIFKRSALVILAVLLMATSSQAIGGEKELYWKARKTAKEGRKDFAYMYFAALLKEFPSTKYREEANFAKGEYQFFLPARHESKSIFEKFLVNYPKSRAKLFATAILLNIARHEKNEEVIQRIEKEIISYKQQGLVFKNSTQHTYRSPLLRNWKAVFHIDTIEFFVEGELFEKVSF